MQSRPDEVVYRITDSAGRVVQVSTRDAPRGALPIWTELRRAQCPSCPLAAETHQRCPAAVALLPLIDCVAQRNSTERVQVEVCATARTTVKATDLQEATQSLGALLMSRSACPRFAMLRRLGRHHLPFASPGETLFRVAGALPREPLALIAAV